MEGEEEMELKKFETGKKRTEVEIWKNLKDRGNERKLGLEKFGGSSF